MSASSSQPSPQQVARALQSLSYDKIRLLAFHLGVETHVLKNIDSSPITSSRSVQAIAAWLDRDTEASWEKIVSALELIGKKVLATQVAEQHCLQSPAAATVDGGGWARVQSCPPLTPPPSSSPPSTDPNQPPFPPPSHRCQPVALRSVADVKSAILHLKKTFSKLVSHTRSEMCSRESQDQEFLDEFRDHLLFLPVAKKAAHVKFFRDNEDDILEAKNIRKLFAILGRYLSFRNYEILQEIVTWFNVAPLVKSMQVYCRMLIKFEMSTSVDIYIVAVPEETDEETKNAFSQMVLRIEKPASECTLYDLRKLNEAIVTNSGLSSHSVYISGVANKCVEVVVRFPSSAAGWVLAALTPHFMTTHHLTEVTLDGFPLPPLLEDTRENLVCAILNISHIVESECNILCDY